MSEAMVLAGKQGHRLTGEELRKLDALLSTVNDMNVANGLKPSHNLSVAIANAEELLEQRKKG